MLKVKEMTVTTYLNESFFFMLLALNVSIISLYLLSKLRRMQAEMMYLRQTFCNDRERMVRNLGAILSRLQSAEGSIESASAVQAELKINKSMNTNLTQANKLLDMGVDSDQLVSNFGLSEAEAQLMSLVHTKQDRINKAA
ncbi:MAG: hypothetical protein ACJA2D_000454 [Pseudohongiellaceae bacterium]|jgi:hypothetical protein